MELSPLLIYSGNKQPLRYNLEVVSELILPPIIMTPGCFEQAQERSITDIAIDDQAMDFIVGRPGMPEGARPDVTVLRAHSLKDPRIDRQHAAPYFSAQDLANEQPGTPYELATLRAAMEAGKRVLQVTVVEWTEADLAAEFIGNLYRERSNSEPISFKGLGHTLLRLVNQNTDSTKPVSNTAEQHRGTNINLARLYKPYRFVLADSIATEQ